MSPTRLVSVTAAGKGERMAASRPGADVPDVPKPMLATGRGETLLGRIVRQAMKIAHVDVYANYDNISRIGQCRDLPAEVRLLVNRNIHGPLGALYLRLLRAREQTLMAAGDFWADFEWSQFLDFHDSQPTPVTILVGRSVPTSNGAVFNVGDDGAIRSWERVSRTGPEDLINIGAYIVDPDPVVVRKIQAVRTHKEDEFNDMLISHQLISAYVADGLAFNVNDFSVYEALMRHTNGRER